MDCYRAEGSEKPMVSADNPSVSLCWTDPLRKNSLYQDPPCEFYHTEGHCFWDSLWWSRLLGSDVVLGLRVPQRTVCAALDEQRLVAALLNDLPLLEHDDLIAEAAGG